MLCREGLIAVFARVRPFCFVIPADAEVAIRRSVKVEHETQGLIQRERMIQLPIRSASSAF